MPTSPTPATARPADPLRAVVDVLDGTESYLSAMHGAVGRHDRIGADLTCGGCALRDRITPALAVARQLLGTTEGAAALSPADGQQKTRLLARLHASLTPIPEETDEEREQREDREEAARLHAAGDHQYCDVTCETAMPTEAMRNFVIAKGYPGTAGALDELLRRAAVPPAPADRAATLRWAADELDSSERLRDLTDDHMHDVNAAANELRRLADGTAAGVQPPTTSEAHPPSVEYIAEVLELDGAWEYLGAHAAPAVAAKRRASVTRRYPDAETRTVRKTTTYTVEPEPAAPAVPEEPQ